MSASTTRELVVVSGYYGFDNLGDEAILEELTNELKQLCPAQQVVVLSANPEKTASLFAVRAEDRMNLLRLMELFKRSRLFVSGGGGLFQDTNSAGSVFFYGMQMMLAKALGAKVLVYAQGLGPLKRGSSKWMTRRAFAGADAIAVRDKASLDMLSGWGVKAVQTADPVWCLPSRPLPDAVEAQLKAIPSGRLVAVSLRQSANFGKAHVDAIVKGLLKAAPVNAHLILLPLQDDQDLPVLKEFAALWRQAGRECTLIDTSALQYPAQWISLFGRCKLVVAMRLHALIMALKAGVAVVGIAYDPKVTHLLAEFEQPGLILAKEPDSAVWEETLVSAFNDAPKLAQRAMRKAEGAKKLACQNFTLLAKILGVQKHG
jgi:polysaccharide pyruvyl transferase CsaB